MEYSPEGKGVLLPNHQQKNSSAWGSVWASTSLHQTNIVSLSLSVSSSSTRNVPAGTDAAKAESENWPEERHRDERKWLWERSRGHLKTSARGISRALGLWQQATVEFTAVHSKNVCAIVQDWITCKTSSKVELKSGSYSKYELVYVTK